MGMTNNNEAAAELIKHLTTVGTPREIMVAVTCFDNEDFDQFSDYTATIEVDGIYDVNDDTFITGLVDTTDYDAHDCDDDCDEAADDGHAVNHTTERFDINVNDIDAVVFL